MKKLYRFIWLVWIAVSTHAQQVYFVDGYHGGIYGHYPVEWKTQFIVDKLAQFPEWKICLEIEPETWDTVQARTPEAYADFRKIANDERVEFTNPTYAQPYAYNISGESLIRQFEYGIRKIRAHFPETEFLTYSVEEPCFTSCLPQILKQFGFKYAVLKCPNTCWGGYPAAYGKDLVNWVGPDGSSLLTVPRYACEALEKNSTWQTTAWQNSTEYLEACRQAGIQVPVGMCFQDAGWRNGPWLGSGDRIKNGSVYTTWKEYIEKYSVGNTTDDWHFTQEDIRPNLMWGSQVLQRIAQEVRTAENRVITAEKIAAMAHWADGYSLDQAYLDEAWRTLMLAQHHDSWIVPYNRLNKYRNWAEEITLWTANTVDRSDKIIEEAIAGFPVPEGQPGNEGYVKVYNPSGRERKETVSILLPGTYAGSGILVRDAKGKTVDCAVETEDAGVRLFFQAETPPFGYAVYSLAKKGSAGKMKPLIHRQGENEWVVENDRYRIVFDASRGGVIKELIAKKEGNKNFVKTDSEYALGELRGYFYEEGRFFSSTEKPARITVVRENAFEASIRIEGEIASHPFTQVVTVRQGERRIDFELEIDWKKNVGIGEYKQSAEHWREPRRAFCDDRFKLNVLFPADLRRPRIYKDAPFDVCESRLENTFFNRWDSIKHNVVLNWVDLTEENKEYGLAVYADHTTSYSYGDDFPLGLTAQYSGVGLWGPDYEITRPLKMNYALVPHRGVWDEAGLYQDNVAWNEPLVVTYAATGKAESRSLMDVSQTGYVLSAVKVSDGGVCVRLFNAEGNAAPQKVCFGFPVEKVEEVDLNGRSIRKMEIGKRRDGADMIVSIPRFGVRTFLVKGKENQYN